MEKKKYWIIVLAGLVLLTAGCALLQKESTPDERYYAARDFVNNNFEDFLDFYELADTATRAKWDQEIYPWFDRALNILDAWKIALGTEDSVAKERLYLKIKDQLIAVLIQEGIIIIKEGE